VILHSAGFRGAGPGRLIALARGYLARASGRADTTGALALAADGHQSAVDVAGVTADGGTRMNCVNTSETVTSPAPAKNGACEP